MRIFLFFGLLFIFFSIPAFAFDVTGVRFGASSEKQRVVIELSGSGTFKAYTLENPSRIIVDMPDFNWKAGNIQKPESSFVKDIRHGGIGRDKARLVFETSRNVSIASSFMLPASGAQPNRIVIDFVRAGEKDNIKQSGLKENKVAASSGEDHDKDNRPYSAGTVQNLAAQLPLPAPVTPPKLQPNASKIAAHAALKSVSAPKKEILSYEDTPASLPPVIPSAKSGNRQKPLIIIDPGHGGQDPGAHAANGNYEKTITLAVGLELKKQLEDSGQYRVQMTRDTDIFIPLQERVKFARRNGGDLFVSLHADSMQDASVTGASVYTLSDTASDKEAEKLAERENKSDAIAGVNLSNQDTDVANILIDLASRDTMNQSRYLANTVVATLPDNGVGMLARKPHRSAGFAVLKAMDIPSILVEMGYLTNMDEANRLSSREYRAEIARGLKASIETYFTKVAKLNTP